MAILIILVSLISLVFGKSFNHGYRSPCDCFSVELMYGYPKVTGQEVCYRYKITKTDYSCPMKLDYYILSAYVYSLTFHIITLSIQTPYIPPSIDIYNIQFIIT